MEFCRVARFSDTPQVLHYFSGKPKMSFREPFRQEMLPRSFRVLPRAQENLVFGPRLEEYLLCALETDLP